MPERKTLTAYSYIPRRHTASYEYRVLVPFRTAHDLGMPVRIHIDTNDAAIDPKDRIQAFCEADVIVLYQPVGESVLQNARMVKQIIPSLREGDWKYPPSLVIDTDDNIFNVNPHNNAYRGLGIRDHEGKDIPPGHTIGVVQGGEKKILWKDGEDGFDIARNRQTLETYRKLLDACDAVTVTTPRTAEYVRAESSPRRCEVFPNLVRFDDYEQPDIVEDPKKLKIMWQGGASHYEDWFPLRGALGEITQKYPEVHWIIWGQLYPWVMDLIPPDRYTFIDWSPYTEYKLRLVMVGHQINLAPLNDNRFNRCRSAIKFYEATVLKKPAATLAQRTGPYADEIIDGETGLLFSDPTEFTAKLSSLIENATLRRQVAANAKDWVSEHRDAFRHAPKLIQFYETLREAAAREQPHMPESEWPEFMARVEEQEKHAEEAAKAEPAAAGA